MQFRFSDLRRVIYEAVLYRIELYTEIDERDIMSYLNTLRRIQKRFPHVSYFMAVSSVESKTAQKTCEYTGKRGRPKIVVRGKKVRLHIHQGAIGNKDGSAYKFQKEVAKSLNKRFGKKVTRVVSMEGLDYITYSYEQSKSFRKGGSFDFSQCFDQFFIEVKL